MRTTSGLASLALLAACGSGGRPAAASRAELPLLRLEARDFTFSVPAHVPAGLTRVRLVNRGSAEHEAQITRLPDGATPEAYLAGARAGETFPVGATDVGGPGKVAGGDSSDVVIALEPGRYAVVCWADGHVMAGMIAPLEVGEPARSATGGAAAPAATGEVEMRDHSFAHAPGVFRSGANVIRVRNTGQRPHDMTVYRLAPGRTLREFGVWYRTRQGEAPAVPVGGMVTLAPGREGWAELDLPPGRYFVACGTPEKTPEGTKIHAQLGMIEEFAIE